MICRCLVFCVFIELSYEGDRIVRIVDIGEIDDHHCFNYLFIIALSDCVVLHIVMSNTLSYCVSLCF